MASPARRLDSDRKPFERKFSDAEVDAMLDMRGSYTPKEIQDLFGISKPHFYHLLRDREKHNAIDSQA